MSGVADALAVGPGPNVALMGVVEDGQYLRRVGGEIVSGPGGAGSDAISIQNEPVSADTPNSGDVLTYDGTEWVPTAATSGERCAASIRCSAAQTVASNAAPLTTVAFDSSDYTPRGGDGAPEVDLVAHTITIKKAGLYRITARVTWAPVAGTGPIGLIVLVNALDPDGLTGACVFPNAAGVFLTTQVVVERELDVDDVVFARLLNTTGVDQSTSVAGAPYNGQILPLLQVSEV